jgi:GTPase Era involved in 16S rRNA processing
MTKVINLDDLETRKDKVVILKGVEHVMKTLTVKDYVQQLKKQAEIEKLTTADTQTVETADRLIELTVDALAEVFPTIPRDQLESLNMEQLNAMRSLAEGYAEEDAPEGEPTGESTGKE